MINMDEIGESAKTAAKDLSILDGNVRNSAISNIAEALMNYRDEIVAENSKDVEIARSSQLSDSHVDRLLLTSDRLDSIATDVLRVVELPDPVGETIEMNTMPNGMQVGRKRVPLGVVGVIFESRPNVTVDISSLCIKSGNAVILRGGSDAFYSNLALSKVIRQAISKAGVPTDAVQVVGGKDRNLVTEMLKMDRFIDLMIPRGGSDLVSRVAMEATMPSITGGVGVCHTYVDRTASVDMAVDIVYNAKVQRPSVCNALDTMLVHSTVAPLYLPRIAEEFAKAGVEMRCDARSMSILGSREDVKIVVAKDTDWDTEFLSLTAGVKIVDSLEDALDHISNHGTGHSEAIVTEEYSSADRFLKEVDSSAVMVNASTRFNDGGQFGLGAEVAISTNKMHARGPMGLREMTSYKWVVLGNGHIRK